MEERIYYISCAKAKQEQKTFVQKFLYRLAPTLELRKSIQTTESEMGEEGIVSITWTRDEVMDLKAQFEFVVEYLNQNLQYDISEKNCYCDLELTEKLNYNNPGFSSFLLEEIQKRVRKSDTHVIRCDFGDDAYTFAQMIYSNLNRLTIILAKYNRKRLEELPEEEAEEVLRLEEQEEMRWNDFCDIAYDNTGLMPKIVSQLPPLIAYEKDKWKVPYYPIFWDFSKESTVDYRNIPQNTLYIDLYPNKLKRRILSEKRKDIRYLSYANFLDSSLRNKL